MLKPIAAGLMCLGFVTLDVAMSRAQDEDLIVIDGEVGATEVQAGDANEDPPGDGATTVNVTGQRFKVIRNEDGEVVVSTEDGKIVENYAGPQPARRSARVFRMARGPEVVDPQTRETLDRVTAGLKEEIKKLEKEGKQEESQRKMQSLRAIESLLHGNPRVTAFGFRHGPYAPQETMEEIRKLHARLNELVEQSSKMPDADGDKTREEILRTQKEIAEKHQSLNAPAPVGGQHQFGIGQFGPQPFRPGMPPGMGRSQIGQQPPGAPPFHGVGWAIAPGQPRQFDSPESMALARKADALSEAAGRLKESGLDDQAKSLQDQAEQFKAKAEQLRQAEAEKHRAHQGGEHGAFGGGGRFGAGGGIGPGGIGPGGIGPGGIGPGRIGPGGIGMGGGFGGGPPMELHRSLHELRDQIQQLRKEVGELRELLQRKP